MESDRDYYEVLQISRKADIETIHRVYRMMATRFHPDIQLNFRAFGSESELLLQPGDETPMPQRRCGV